MKQASARHRRHSTVFINHNSSFSGGRSWFQHPREIIDSLIHWSLRILPQLENPMVKLVHTLGVFHSNRIQLLFSGSSQEVYAHVVLDLVKQLERRCIYRLLAPVA